LLQWANAVALAALLASVKLLPTVEFTGTWPRQVEVEQRSPPAQVIAGLFDPRQATLYKARRDRDLSDAHPAKAMSAAETASVLGYVDRRDWVMGFHEYGAHIGLLGIILAAWGAWAAPRDVRPLFAAGVVAGIVVFGASAPVDLWRAIRHLPLYTQLQVPSRFLAAVVFVLAVAAAFGMDALGRALRSATPRWSTTAQALAMAVVYVELTSIAWSVFRDVFVVTPVPVARHDDFAQRFAAPSLQPDVMTSTMLAYMRANSGTLQGYENLSVGPGRVSSPSDDMYRGEVYLARGRGRAEMRHWTMSRVTVDVTATEREQVVLNQNYDRGWQARRRDGSGALDVVAATRTADGLIAVPVDQAHTQVELFYAPPGFVKGAWVSGVTLLLCSGVLWFTRTRRRDAHLQGAAW
jgi:hypothetical protein